MRREEDVDPNLLYNEPPKPSLLDKIKAKAKQGYAWATEEPKKKTGLKGIFKKKE